MYYPTRRNGTLIAFLLAVIGSLNAQTTEGLLVLDANTPRQVITAYSQEQIINFQHLKKGETYLFVVPLDKALGTCHPEVSLIEPTAQLVDYSPDEHLLRFKATSSIAQIRLLYPCGWNEANPPRHYISISCQSCTGKEAEKGIADMLPLGVQYASALELIRDVFIGGDCFDVSNVTYNGGSDKIGKFSNGLNSIGFNNGMIMCTGDINVAPGPNNSNGAGGGGAGGNDADLGAIASGPLFDQAVIEFDFTPTQSTFSFEYVFASEEYCEYVNTSFNDVFGFFISGPGIAGTKNLAVVPSTNNPITINSVNHLVNSGLYTPNTPVGSDNCENGGVCNCLPPQPPASGLAVQELEYDGFTKKITAFTPVIPCFTYHVKLAIADVGDGVWDSAVFLQGSTIGNGGQASINWIVNSQVGVDTATEGCSTAGLLIDRLGPNLSQPLAVSFSIGGTAINGLDYGPINSTYIIPAGVDKITVPVNIASDMISEGTETVVLTLNNACSCSNPQKKLTIADYVPMVPKPDTVRVCGSSGVGTVGVTVQGGVKPYSYQWSVGGNGSSITVFASQSTNYTVTVTDACGWTKTAVARINILSPATAQFVPPSPQLCPGQTAQLMINFNGVGPFQFAYQFNGTPQPAIFGIPNGIYKLLVGQPGLYQGSTLVDGDGCLGTVSGASLVVNSTLALTGVVFNATAPNTANGSINTTVTGGQGPYQYNWQGPVNLGNVADPTNLLPGNYKVTVTDGFGCAVTQSFSVGPIVSPWQVTPTGRNHTIILPDTLKSDFQWGSLQIGDRIGVFYDSAGTTTLKCGGFIVWSGSNIAIAAYGNDAAPPGQNGFMTGELFKIKIWRSATNQIFDVTGKYAPVGWLGGLVSHTKTFSDDGISMITALSTAATHPITLNSGWNMISSYVIPADPGMLDVFNPIASSVDIIKDGDGNIVIPSPPLILNQIGNWNLLKGYQVRANKKDTLLVVGQQAVPEDNPIPLLAGWQIISYLRDSPQNIDTVFKNIKSQISLVKDNAGHAYSPQFNINTIGNMLPGEGYKVKALSNVTLAYRSNFTGPEDELRPMTKSDNTTHFVLDDNLNTGNNATIVLTDLVANTMMAPGDEIAVFSPQGKLCGASPYRQGENLAITVWGDDPSTNDLTEGLQPGDAYSFRLWSHKEQKEYTAVPFLISDINAYEPDAIEIVANLNLGSSGIAELEVVGVQSLQLFPNPASESLTIDIKSKEAGKVALTVLSLGGTRVWDSESFEYQAGTTTHPFTVPAKLPSGLYWFQFQFAKGVLYRQVFIQK